MSARDTHDSVRDLDLGEPTCPACGSRSLARSVRRRFGREVFAVLAPVGERDRGPAEQAASLRDRLERLLAASGGRATVVSETWFTTATPSLEAPSRREGEAGCGAVSIVGLSPCCDRCAVVLHAHIVVEERGSVGAPEVRALELSAAAAAAGVSGSTAVARAGDVQVRLSGITAAAPERPFEEECDALFETAAALLAPLGLGFRDVVRTWIYLADIGADYAALNRARRVFFERHRVRPYPASTGVGDAWLPGGARCALSLHAVGRRRPDGSPAFELATLHSPTFNEAYEYGSCFSRGMRVGEGDVAMLYLSGTAAIDERGRSRGPGDLAAQVEQTASNLSGLLAAAGAGFENAVRAVSYVCDPGEVLRFRRLLDDAGLAGVPHIVVEGVICRPELVCETEVVAAAAEVAG